MKYLVKFYFSLLLLPLLTHAQPRQIADINPGAGSGYPAVVADGYDGRNRLVAFDGALYFAADNGVHGVELWRTDGVTDTMVAYQQAGAGDSAPTRLMAICGAPGGSLPDGYN